MIYRIIQPAVHLSTYIKHYSLLDFRLDSHVTPPVKPFPAHTDQNLVFYLRGRITACRLETGETQQFARIAINGSQTVRLDFHLPSEYLMLAVHFQTGILSKFLRMPLPEFTDQRADAEAMLNPGISELYERLVNTTDQNELITILEDYLWQRIQKMRMEFHPIDRVAQLMRGRVVFSVEKLADAACLSVSQFERRFLQQTGIPPKVFLRINRFYDAFLLKEDKPKLSWLAIALYAGYHDYQHLVKDFKVFAVETPNSLMEAQAKAPERILDINPKPCLPVL